MTTDTPVFVRVPSTREDRAERVAFAHQAASRPGKPVRQTRSNERRRAIRESREDSRFLA